jgi:hypothetical protein
MGNVAHSDIMGGSLDVLGFVNLKKDYLILTS